MPDYEIHPTCQIPAASLQAIYQAHFGYRPTGQFVEVGAYDGMTYGHTWGLARAGWHGLYIEPNPVEVDRCRANHSSHPNITTAPFAVGSVEGNTKLYLGGEVSSTTYGRIAKDWGLDPNKFITVPTYRLDTLLELFGIKPEFDLLVIDVEESEVDVLRSFNIGHYRPRMAIIETHAAHPEHRLNWKAKPIDEYFQAADYRSIHFDEVNTIYARNP